MGSSWILGTIQDSHRDGRKTHVFKDLELENHLSKKMNKTCWGDANESKVNISLMLSLWMSFYSSVSVAWLLCDAICSSDQLLIQGWMSPSDTKCLQHVG